MSSTANTEESVVEDLAALLEDLSGRVGVTVNVVNSLNGEVTPLCQFDMDAASSSVVLAFKNQSEDTQEEFTFAFTEDAHRKNTMNRRDRARRQEQFQQLESELGQELRWNDITAEDYFADTSIDFMDLPEEERVKVLRNDLDHLIFEFERITECRDAKGGFLTNLFRRRK